MALHCVLQAVVTTVSYKHNYKIIRPALSLYDWTADVGSTKRSRRLPADLEKVKSINQSQIPFYCQSEHHFREAVQNDITLCKEKTNIKHRQQPEMSCRSENQHELQMIKYWVIWPGNELKTPKPDVGRCCKKGFLLISCLKVTLFALKHKWGTWF